MISVPPGTEMFQFPGLAPLRVTGLALGRVSPFGHPGITARVQLPQAYRSLPRPSSPLDAKASTVCLIAFDLKFDCCMQHYDADSQSVLIPHTVRALRPGHHPSFGCQRAEKRSELEMRAVRATSRDLSCAAASRRTTRYSRKEVIQPQVPLRLPCYDFAPVTELTFDGCLLAVSPPTSGPPSFHGVTGGVYKARERIHRGVADPRLLAIPASCSRVADYNPNLDRLLAISALSRVGDALYRPL